jgi:transposase
LGHSRKGLCSQSAFGEPSAATGTLRTRRIRPLVARRRTTHGSGLRRWRWVVERTFAWLNQFRRLRDRYDNRADIHEACLSLGCALICWHFLRKTSATG